MTKEDRNVFGFAVMLSLMGDLCAETKAKGIEAPYLLYHNPAVLGRRRGLLRPPAAAVTRNRI